MSPPRSRAAILWASILSFFAFPPWLVASALGFAILFALFGAFGPARRASKVDPALALAER